jgi:hypothetical protein
MNFWFHKKGRHFLNLATTMKMAVFRDVAQYSLADIDRRFGEAYCLHHQGDESSHSVTISLSRRTVLWIVTQTYDWVYPNVSAWFLRNRRSPCSYLVTGYALQFGWKRKPTGDWSLRLPGRVEVSESRDRRASKHVAVLRGFKLHTNFILFIDNELISWFIWIHLGNSNVLY